jgi:hypothetical protein
MITTGGLKEKRVLVVCKAVADDAQTRTRHSHTIQYVAMQSAHAPDKRKVTFEWHPELGAHPELGTFYLRLLKRTKTQRMIFALVFVAIVAVAAAAAESGSSCVIKSCSG